MLSCNKTPSIHRFYFLPLDKEVQNYLHMQNQTEPLGECKLFVYKQKKLYLTFSFLPL